MFKNYGPIWEIGGVHTDPAYRRQGLARRVVAAAARELISSGRIPRYQVKETNLASLAVAEALGMQHFVTTEHFIFLPKKISAESSPRDERDGKGGKRCIGYFGQKTRRELRKYLSQRKTPAGRMY